MENFHEKSYQAQTEHISTKLNKLGIDDILLNHIKKDCVSTKLNLRTLEILNPFLKEQNKWLTVGDYYGHEAAYLKEKNQLDTASDLSDALLSKIHASGIISNYEAINVEKIEHQDNSFDYILCREAYHHFPRPYLAVYEMIRVSSKAVFLIEPIDILAKMPLLLFIKNILDRFNPNLINKIWKNRYSFESVGNYVFKISEREVEKLAMGMGLPCIAYKSINVYLSNCNPASFNETPYNKGVWRKIMLKTRFKDFLNFLTLIPKNTLCSVIFKTDPSAELVAELEKEGFTLLYFPKNPYLK